jgi:hypothetical protein
MRDLSHQQRPGTRYISESNARHHKADSVENERGSGMKAATIVGILLIVLGIIGFAAGGVSFTHEKKDVDLGPLQVSHKENKTLPISPILSTVSLIAGVGLLVVGVRSK